MRRLLSITTFVFATAFVSALGVVAIATTASAQAPEDDGWDDEGDDGWGDEDAQPEEQPKPEKPKPKPDEGGDDDGWGDEEQPPAEQPKPDEAGGGDDDWGDEEQPPAEQPKPDEAGGGDDDWGDEEQPPAEQPKPDEAGGDGDDWGDEEAAGQAETTPEPAPPEPEPEPEPELPPMPTPPEGLTGGAKMAFTAGALIDRGEFTAAEAKASLAAVTAGGEVEGQIQMARLRLRQGRLREALQAARQAVSQGPESAPARLFLIRLMSAQGESVREQVTAIERLTQKFPDDLGMAVALGESQLATKQNAAAMRTARSVLKRAETSVTAMKLLARAYYGNGNDATAESILERAVGIEEDAEACHLMSQIFLKRNNVVQARVWLDRAIAADPLYVEALNNLGVAYIKMRDFPAALRILPLVTRLAPGFGAAWLNLGIAQRGVKRFVDAEKSWKEVLKVEPRMSDAWFNLGVLYLENEMPGLQKEPRLNQSIDAFNRYRHGARMRGDVDKSIDTYIAEAKRLIDQEKKAKEKALKKPTKGDDDDWGDDDGGGGDDDDWGDDEGGGDAGGDAGGDDDWGDDDGGDDDW